MAFALPCFQMQVFPIPTSALWYCHLLGTALGFIALLQSELMIGGHFQSGQKHHQQKHKVSDTIPLVKRLSPLYPYCSQPALFSSSPSKF